MPSDRSNNLDSQGVHEAIKVLNDKEKFYICPYIGIQDLRSAAAWRDVICEITVAFFLWFLVQAMILNFNTPDNPSTSLLLAGLGGGLTVYVLIEAFGHVQLAAMNPGSCIHFALTGQMSVTKAILYIFGQPIGGTLAAGVVYSCAPESARVNLKPLEIHPEMTALQGAVIEWMIASTMILTLAGSTDERKRKVYLPGLAVGVAISVGILAGGHFTGGAVNPNVVFGPAIITGKWKAHWIYWVGAILAGFTGTLFYHFTTYDKGVFSPRTKIISSTV